MRICLRYRMQLRLGFLFSKQIIRFQTEILWLLCSNLNLVASCRLLHSCRLQGSLKLRFGFLWQRVCQAQHEIVVKHLCVVKNQLSSLLLAHSNFNTKEPSRHKEAEDKLPMLEAGSILSNSDILLPTLNGCAKRVQSFALFAFLICWLVFEEDPLQTGMSEIRCWTYSLHRTQACVTIS